MSRTAAILCMGGLGHVQVLLPVATGLRARGLRVVALSREAFRARFEAAGAEFIDLYAGRPLEAVDAVSMPLPTRFVTFAAAHAEALAAELRELGAALLVHDTFTVVAPVAARLLDVPCIHVHANHALVPARALADLARDPRVAISEGCLAAVERLRRVHGLAEASPFSYVASHSPWLNLYNEPEEFLSADDRVALAPLAFTSSLPERLPPAAPAGAGRLAYAAFGTGIFRYFGGAAGTALELLAGALRASGRDVVVSLGGQEVAPDLRARLAATGAAVHDEVDQWSILGRSEAFATHHGLNSTHEAIRLRVPMLSCPFFGDQPALARRCAELGLAVPVGEPAGGALEADAVRAAVARLDDERARLARRLDEAAHWEERTLAARPAVLDAVAGVAGARGHAPPAGGLDVR